MTLKYHMFSFAALFLFTLYSLSQRHLSSIIFVQTLQKPQSWIEICIHCTFYNIIKIIVSKLVVLIVKNVSCRSQIYCTSQSLSNKNYACKRVDCWGLTVETHTNSLNWDHRCNSNLNLFVKPINKRTVNLHKP